MDTLEKISTGFQFLKSKVSNKETPIAVRWNITYRCNLNCEYCNLPEKADRKVETDTEKVKQVLDEMADLGVKRISFSGGEPLLRKDIGEIIDYTSGVGISPTMNTNGVLVTQKINELNNLDLLKVSLDGSKETHNKLRGKYEETIRGIKTAIGRGIKTTLCSTFTNENYEDVPKLVKKAEEFGTLIAIQRVTNLYENFEKAGDMIPRSEEIEDLMERLIKIKREKPNTIRNSIRHLEFIKNFPSGKEIDCTAGKLFCIIHPDGTVTPCDRIKVEQKLPNINNLSFKDCFDELNEVDCNGCCFCGSMEINYLYHLKLDTLKDLMNFIHTNKR